MKKWRSTAYNCPLPPLTARPDRTRTAAYRPCRVLALKLLPDVFSTVDARVALRRQGGRSLESRRSGTLSHRSVGAANRSRWFRLAYASAPESRLLDGSAYGSVPVPWLVTLRTPTRRARGASRGRRNTKASRESGIETSAFILMTGLFPGTGEVDSEGTSTRLCSGASSSCASGLRAHRYHH
jgi:hypothetical protein